MADPFPDLRAVSRSYELTPLASSEYVTDATSQSITFLHGVAATNRIIEIKFPLLTTTEADQIGDHYVSVKAHGLFTIPSNLWRMHSSLYDVTPANQLYKYNRPPQREYNEGLYTVTVEFRTILNG